ncbi:hypothetical protein AYO46_10075 [Betaproteobacteria bacterium SCGC AG-212-J23]|nr:hypothetical protein AYO46_10075 [Betaproteobacteria bacterium SCGC AG-212-J23]
MIRLLALLLIASPAVAAPKIDVLNVKPDAAKPEVELTISVTKSGGNCDVRVDFGDGKGRTIDFGLATTRTMHYTYAKGGSYKVTAKGTGKSPCAAEKEAAVKVAGPAEKKAEKKKADKKSASKKKEAPK